MHAGSPHSGLLHHLADVAEGHAAINAASAGHQQHPSATHDNGSNCSYGSGTWRLVNQAGTNGLTNIHRTHFDKEALFAVVEAPTPGPLTGMSTLGTTSCNGFSNLVYRSLDTAMKQYVYLHRWQWRSIDLLRSALGNLPTTHNPTLCR